MKRIVSLLLACVLLCAMTACGVSSPAAQEPSPTPEPPLPEITLPQEIEECGYPSNWPGWRDFDEDIPLFSEDLTLDDFAAVLGESSFSLEGWAPDDAWHQYISCSFLQSGKALAAGATWSKNSPNAQDNVYAMLGVSEFETLFPENYPVEPQRYDFAGCPVTVLWSASSSWVEPLVYCVAWIDLDTDRNLRGAFDGWCVRDNEAQVEELLLVLNSFLRHCARHREEIDLHALDRAVPYPSPTPDPFRVLQYAEPREISIDQQGRLHFDEQAFDRVSALLDPTPLLPAQPIGGVVWPCEEMLQLSLPILIWKSRDGARQLFLADRRTFGFLEVDGERELAQIDASLQWVGLKNDGVQILEDDRAALAWTGYEEENILQALQERRGYTGYYRGKSLMKMACSFAQQSGRQAFVPQPEIREDAVVEVEGVSIDESGWLHFDDPQRDADYRLLAPAVDQGWQDEAEEWSPWQESGQPLASWEGRLAVMVPLLLWQDDEENPSQKIYGCYQREWEAVDQEGNKSMGPTGMTQCLAVMSLDEAGNWQVWVDFDHGVGRESLPDEVQVQMGLLDSQLSTLGEPILRSLGHLKNNFAFLSGRAEYLESAG